MSAFSVMPLMSLLDSLGHRQLLRMLHPDVGSQHSEGTARALWALNELWCFARTHIAALRA
jgi:hypothetical protein